MNMGGSALDTEADWSSIEKTTIVLVGRTGNGKSATGNSILGQRIFRSAKSQTSVTSTCELASSIRDDGRCVSVIDTPGLFDSSLEADNLMKEISKCIELAREGVHALVLVLSTRNRFTMEEMAAVDSLQTIFGEKAFKYMIVVFTGGDELEEEGQTLEDYLPNCRRNGAPPSELEILLEKCGGRKLVFDNKTKDLEKNEQQTAELLRLVDEVVEANGSQPYTNALFREAQELAKTLAQERELEQRLASSLNGGDLLARESFEEWRKELQQAHAEQLRIVTDMVEEKLKTAADRQQRVLEERLAAEKAAREAAERQAQEATSKASEELQRLRRELDEAKQQREEMKRKIECEVGKGGCAIL